MQTALKINDSNLLLHSARAVTDLWEKSGLSFSCFKSENWGGVAENMGSNITDKIPIWEKSNLTIREAAEYSNIGINRIEELLKIPNCKFVLYVGKKKLVKRREFDKFLSDTVEI